jgi:hypothetical protein
MAMLPTRGIPCGIRQEIQISSSRITNHPRHFTGRTKRRLIPSASTDLALATDPVTIIKNATLLLPFSSSSDATATISGAQLLSPSPSAQQQQEGQSSCAVVFFLTHCADLGSPELIQRLIRNKIPQQLKDLNVPYSFITIGTPSNATAFKQLFSSTWPGGVDTMPLYIDPDGSLYTKLGFSKGFAPNTEAVSPYVKLLAMLAGLGSPGTIPEVLRGYIGDMTEDQVFERGTFLGDAFNVLGSGYQRPLELATLRLQNMVQSLRGWGELAPPEAGMLTWLGGCVVVRDGRVEWRYDDRGILQTVDEEEVLRRVREIESN